MLSVDDAAVIVIARVQCFGTCGTSFESCQSEMDACVKRLCAKRRRSTERSKCLKDAGGHTAATDMFGCKFFQDAQAKACVCMPLGAHSEDEL